MNIYKIQAITVWNLLSSNYLLSGQNKKGSIFTVKVLFLDPRQFSESATRDPRPATRDPRPATRDTRQLYTLSLFTSPEKSFRKQKTKSFLLSALPHCRYFSKSTATRERLPCIVDILKLKTHFFEKKKKRRWNHETWVLNGHTKRNRRQREKLPAKALSASFSNLPPKKISRRSIS